MKNSLPERCWVLRDAVTCEPYLTQESEPEFNNMTEIFGGRECYWAFEQVEDAEPFEIEDAEPFEIEDESGPPYDAATRTGMYDYW